MIVFFIYQIMCNSTCTEKISLPARQSVNTPQIYDYHISIYFSTVIVTDYNWIIKKYFTLTYNTATVTNVIFFWDLTVCKSYKLHIVSKLNMYITFT